MTDITATQTGTSEAAPSEATTAPAGTLLTQDQFNAALAKERREWQAKQRAETERARQEAEQAAAERNGEYQRLADERKTKITTLEGDLSQHQERINALTEAMNAQIESRVNALPDEVRALLPTNSDPLALFAALPNAEALAAKLQPAAPTQAAPRVVTPTGPRGTGTSAGNVTPSTSDLMERKRRSGIY